MRKSSIIKYRNRHIDSVHDTIKYDCNICEYKATERGHLKKHIESVHAKVSV